MRERSFSPEITHFTIGTAQHFRWLYGIVKSIVVMNLLDAVLTLAWVRTGVAEEANIFMRAMVNEQALLFMIVKLGLVSLGALYLWHISDRPLAVFAIFGAFMIYYFVLLAHLEISSYVLLSFLGS